MGISVNHPYSWKYCAYCDILLGETRFAFESPEPGSFEYLIYCSKECIAAHYRAHNKKK